MSARLFVRAVSHRLSLPYTSSSVLAAAKPQAGGSQSADSVRAFAAVADVLHTVLDGSTSSENFARCWPATAPTSNGSPRLGKRCGSAKLIELGALGQVERQKTLMLIAAREAEARRQALESSEAERDALRITAAKLAAEVDSLREQLAFHAQFSPPPGRRRPPRRRRACRTSGCATCSMTTSASRRSPHATRSTWPTEPLIKPNPNPRLNPNPLSLTRT